MTYEENIKDIASICDYHKVPYTIRQIYEGWQIRFPWCDGDVACHDGTYNCKAGYVESYEFPWDNRDVSILTPTQAGLKIVEYYKSLANQANG